MSGVPPDVGGGAAGAGAAAAAGGAAALCSARAAALEPSQRVGRRLALRDGPGAQRRRQRAERTAEPRWHGRGRSYRRRRDAGEEALRLQLAKQLAEQREPLPRRRRCVHTKAKERCAVAAWQRGN